MDFKQAGNLLYLVGETRDELGGSHFALVNRLEGGQVPTMDPERARETFAAVHSAIRSGLVRACHDLSEGGLAVAAAEMAFAGGLGARVDLDAVPWDGQSCPSETDRTDRIVRPTLREAAALLFSESNTRFLCEVPAERASEFERVLGNLRYARIGEVTAEPRLVMTSGGRALVDAELATLKEAWQSTFRW
jgi:phosphoribosylformylglycinamidine synthase